MTHADLSPVQSPAAAAGAMKPSEALRKARALITPEGAWTQKAYARTISGDKVNGFSPNAVCWCSIGSFQRVAGKDYDLRDEMERFLEKSMDGDIFRFNDRRLRTHAEVLAAFDAATDLAIAEGR